ncbi:cell division protein FtsA [Moraxella sp. Tifton1]|uniref:Cell division protein FtsA n=1 Tax=Moraxella oculi TaxID=2940516 RepID=A0ABW8U4J2_9GAMM|nr:cell division protein FtsA [Moraxella sp. Tifton1]MCL1622888.1 cell division protein FtsA [Moraxella sp. Tifton1]
MDELQVALHLSSTAVHTVVGYPFGTPEQPQIKIVAVGLAHHEAFTDGRVGHREHLLSAIHKSLREASDMAGVAIEEVCLSFASSLMKSTNDSQEVQLCHAGGCTTVRPGDLYRVKELIADRLLAEGYSLVQHCPQLFYLDDDSQDVKDPLGMHANKLKVLNHVVMLPSNHERQITDVIHNNDILIGQMFFDGIMGAEYALTKEEKKRGVCFIDIGQATTKVCVFLDGVLVFSECFDVGGQTVTFDIAAELGVSVPESEASKRQYGTLQPSPGDKATFITLPCVMRGEKTVSLRQLINIILARYEEIFDRIYRQLDDKNLSSCLGAGVVLAGGGCQIEGIVKFLNHKWAMPVRMMTTNEHISVCPKNLTDHNIVLINDHIKGNKLHTAIGALLYQNSEQFLRNGHDDSPVQSDLVNKISNAWQSFAKSVKKWF